MNPSDQARRLVTLYIQALRAPAKFRLQEEVIAIAAISAAVGGEK